MKKRDYFLLAFSFICVVSFYQVYKHYKIETLAECLSEKKVVMYGAKWCEHCNAQKLVFGSAFEKVDYFECAKVETLPQSQDCFARDIRKYPTWMFEDGKKLEGFQSLETLDKIAACNVF